MNRVGLEHAKLLVSSLAIFAYGLHCMLFCALFTVTLTPECYTDICYCDADWAALNVDSKHQLMKVRFFGQSVFNQLQFRDTVISVVPSASKLFSSNCFAISFPGYSWHNHFVCYLLSCHLLRPVFYRILLCVLFCSAIVYYFALPAILRSAVLFMSLL